MQTQLKKQWLDLACSPYRPTGRFNYHWARGKLAGDPIFAALVEHGIFPNGARVLDLGCGRGLLAAWCLAAERLAARGAWPAQITAPPSGLSFRGVELMAREAQCGNDALQPIYGQRVQLTGGDMRVADMNDLDVVAILDVLHYIPHAQQNQMLDRIRAALGSGGIFVTRVGNAGSGWRFTASQWVDRCISFAQGHRLARMWCRPVSAWTQALEDRGFSVEALPMSAGTPFANVMLVARVA
ncbi:class I SAM-dependent methyltransferase [Rhodoferax sp.]|uniref:class I SAM-dependent methyltransferase n=1 Tax=Rhodoferax sp. TaxID=50421 RepID=UPI0027757AAB|nr:class I SAM-dependent methyltransferase [Rhodoferax sp.]